MVVRRARCKRQVATFRDMKRPWKSPSFNVELPDGSSSSLLDHWATALPDKRTVVGVSILLFISKAISGSPWCSCTVGKLAMKYEVLRYGALGLEVDSVVEGSVVIGWHSRSHCNKKEQDRTAHLYSTIEWAQNPTLAVPLYARMSLVI